MHPFSEDLRPLMGLGMTSLVLGTIALLLAFLPILGIPISVLGLFFGLVGLAGGLLRGGLTLRFGMGGTILCSMALTVNIALAYAPGGYIPGRGPKPPWEQPPGRPYIPPPAYGAPAPE